MGLKSIYKEIVYSFYIYESHCICTYLFLKHIYVFLFKTTKKKFYRISLNCFKYLLEFVRAFVHEKIAIFSSESTHLVKSASAQRNTRAFSLICCIVDQKGVLILFGEEKIVLAKKFVTGVPTKTFKLSTFR